MAQCIEQTISPIVDSLTTNTTGLAVQTVN
jgi:hypothetical protein